MMLKEDRRAEVVTNHVKMKVQPSLWIDSTLRKKRVKPKYRCMKSAFLHDNDFIHL